MDSLISYVLRDDVPGLQRAIANGAKPSERDGDGRTPLIHAAIDNRLAVADLLLQSGADTDAQDRLGNSALHYAAQEHHLELTSLLINYGATVDLEDGHGNTPLWRAVFNSRGRGELIQILVTAGADRHHRNKHGKTPFDLANSIANYDVVRFFD